MWVKITYTNILANSIGQNGMIH